MSLQETVQISREEFIATAASFIQAETEILTRKMNSAEPLVEQIGNLAAEARAAGVLLDDASAAENPVAADIRSRMDPLVAQISAIQRDIGEVRHISETARALIDDGIDGTPVFLSASDALRLLRVDLSGLV
jgi:hypothetical protein